MEISITKRQSNDHIISCKRKDGSVTWMHGSPFFVIHDICHYAVETVLGFKNSFYGMLAEGTNISDFELPKDQRTFELNDEALLTEAIVNLLTIEFSQGQFEDFTDELSRSEDSEINKQFLAELRAGKLVEIRDQFNSLMERWKQLDNGDKLILEFNES